MFPRSIRYKLTIEPRRIRSVPSDPRKCNFLPLTVRLHHYVRALSIKCKRQNLFRIFIFSPLWNGLERMQQHYSNSCLSNCCNSFSESERCILFKMENLKQRFFAAKVDDNELVGIFGGFGGCILVVFESSMSKSSP